MNHILHLLVSVFLLGIWLPVWLLIGLTAPERCQYCATEIHSSGGGNASKAVDGIAGYLVAAAMAILMIAIIWFVVTMKR